MEILVEKMSTKIDLRVSDIENGNCLFAMIKTQWTKGIKYLLDKVKYQNFMNFNEDGEPEGQFKLDDFVNEKKDSGLTPLC
jgi:hypothetical protein